MADNSPKPVGRKRPHHTFSQSSTKKSVAYDSSRSSHVRRKVDRPHRAGPRRTSSRHDESSSYARREDIVIPPLDKEGVRIVPLGGVEEVGRNMTVIETPEDIFVVDADRKSVV